MKSTNLPKLSLKQQSLINEDLWLENDFNKIKDSEILLHPTIFKFKNQFLKITLSIKLQCLTFGLKISHLHKV